MCHSPLRRECPPDPFVSVRHPERQNSSSAQLLRKTSFSRRNECFQKPPTSSENTCRRQIPATGVWSRRFPPPTDNFREIPLDRFSPRCLRCNKSNLLGCTSCCCCGARLVRSAIRSLLRPGSCSLSDVSVGTTKHPRLIINMFHAFFFFN